MKEKVAIIDSLGSHGSSHHFYLFGQAKGLQRSGLEVYIYTNNITKNPNYKGVKFYQFYKDIFGGKLKLLSGIRYVLGSIFSLLHAKFHRVTICHYHLFHVNFLVFIDFMLSKLLGFKVVYTVHDVVSFENSKSSKRLSHWIYKRANKILTHNEFSKEAFKIHMPNINTEIDIIPHGNYIPFLKTKKNKKLSRDYLKISHDKKVLLFFGMIKKVKGLEVLLKAMKEVIKDHSDVLLVIAGRVWENDFAFYQKIIEDNNLSDYCLIHNRFIPHEDVGYYYDSSDLVVLPYKRIYQSGVLMMSMSYKKAVLVSDLCPLTDVVKDMKTGFVFESENPQSLSSKLNSILSDLDKLEEIRVEGFNHIKLKYDWLKIGKEMKKSYQSIL